MYMRYARFRDSAGNVRKGKRVEDGLRFGGETYDPDDVDILPPSEPSKIVCVGLNYADHAEESNAEVPDRPLLFLKGPNTLAGQDATITLPKSKETVEYEAELGIIIGKQCRNVAAMDAMDAVEGFTCVNDISNRDDQQVEQNWIRGKAFDNAAPMGPGLATPDEVPKDARICLRQNGEVKQDSSRSQLIFPVPELIEEITSFMTLEPGDVISTGTPAGVDQLEPGDTIEVEIEGVGTLVTHIGSR